MQPNRTPNERLYDLRVVPIGRNDAKRMVLAKHYMRTFPQGSKAYFAVMDGRQAVGVAVFGLSMGTKARVEKLGVYGLQPGQFLEMQRLWISDKYGHNTESFTLSRIMKLLRDAGVRFVVTHAGGCKNDCGFVYQASGWLYFGRQRCEDFYLTSDGEYRNIAARMRFRDPGMKGLSKSEVCSRLFGPGELVDSWRYLYVYPIDKAIRRRLTKLQQPFPKESARYRLKQEWVN